MSKTQCEWACRPGEAQNCEVPPKKNSSNREKARKLGYTHCKGAPAYAHVITPDSMDEHDGARSGAFTLDCMLCNVGSMLQLIKRGVAMAYLTFSCKVDGPDTFGKTCTVYSISKPMLGSTNLANLLLIIKIIDITLQQVGKKREEYLIRDRNVHTSAKGIFSALRIFCPESPTFMLYSMGRATGGWWLGMVAKHIMEKFLKLMNHSKEVAKRFYWTRATCEFLFNGTAFCADARPNSATLPCAVDNIVLPVEEDARSCVQQHVDHLGSDLELSQYFEQMRVCHGNGGISQLTLKDAEAALEGLLEPRNPLAPYRIAGYDIATAVGGINPHFFVGFKLHEHKDKLLENVHAERDAFMQEWHARRCIGWSNVVDQWIDFSKAKRSRAPAMQTQIQPSLQGDNLRLSPPASDESHTLCANEAFVAPDSLSGPTVQQNLMQSAIQNAVQTAVQTAIQSMFLPALPQSAVGMQQPFFQTAIQAAIQAAVAGAAQAGMSAAALPALVPIQHVPTPALVQPAPALVQPAPTSVQPAPAPVQHEPAPVQPAAGGTRTKTKRMARLPCDTAAPPAKKAKVSAAKNGAKAAKVNAITPSVVDTCDMCCIPGRGDGGKPEPWFFLLQSPAKLPEDREGVMYFPATIVAPSLAELTQTKDGFAAKLYEGDAEIVKDSQCTIVQFVVVGDTIVISNDEMKRANEFVLECTGP